MLGIDGISDLSENLEADLSDAIDKHDAQSIGSIHAQLYQFVNTITTAPENLIINIKK